MPFLVRAGFILLGHQMDARSAGGGGEVPALSLRIGRDPGRPAGTPPPGKTAHSWGRQVTHLQALAKTQLFLSPVLCKEAPGQRRSSAHPWAALEKTGSLPGAETNVACCDIRREKVKDKHCLIMFPPRG